MTESGPSIPGASVLLRRALCLRCPLCGKGRLFRGLFRMEPRCASCLLVYEREPGYFLGSIYFSYGALALASIVASLILQQGLGWSGMRIFVVLSGLLLLVTIPSFRYGRALWLAFDLLLDPPRDHDYRKD